MKSLKLLIILFFSCTTKQEIGVYITYRDLKKETPKDSLVFFREEYIEISLQISGEDQYIPKFEIYDSSDEFLLNSMYFLSTSKSIPIRFKSISEFLNYMSKHGYDMKEHTKYTERIEYLFKKK